MRQTPISQRIIASAIPIVTEPEQKEWRYYFSGTEIPPFSYAVYEVTTVADGEKLMLNGLTCSTTSNTTDTASNKIMSIIISVKPQGLIEERYFRRTEVITYEPLQEIKAGQTLYVYFCNRSSDEVTVAIITIGVILVA